MTHPRILHEWPLTLAAIIASYIIVSATILVAISVPTSTARTFNIYWVGGPGKISENRWAYSSGGHVEVNPRTPGPGVAVIFDTNSGNGIVIVDKPTISSFLIISGNITLQIIEGGSWTLIPETEETTLPIFGNDLMGILQLSAFLVLVLMLSVGVAAWAIKRRS